MNILKRIWNIFIHLMSSIIYIVIFPVGAMEYLINNSVNIWDWINDLTEFCYLD